MSVKTVLLDGQLTSLGKKVGRGGEGAVFAVEDGSARAVKLYFSPDDAQHAKLQSMISSALWRSCANVAFPRAIATAPDGAFAGFVMPLILGHQPIHELYSTRSRLRLFPNADFRFLVRAAANTARAIAAVHAQGVVIGDLNQSSILISRSATTMVIDADSFQLDDHPCRVGVADYTPPDLQGKDLRNVVRTADHDAFALAVLIFQTLGLGRHPYAGLHNRRDTGLAAAIAGNHFAYSLVRRTGCTAPTTAVSLADLPLGMRTAFERSFGMVVGLRPTALEWVGQLTDLEASLINCLSNDRHFYHFAASHCPWCRIERQVSHSLFGKGGLASSMPLRFAPDQSWQSRLSAAISLARMATRSATPAAASTSDQMRRRQIGRKALHVRLQAVANRGIVGRMAAHRAGAINRPSLTSNDRRKIERLAGSLERNRAVFETLLYAAVPTLIEAQHAARRELLAEALVRNLSRDARCRG